MHITFGRYSVAGVALALLVACTTDDDDPGVEGDDGGATATTGSGGSSANTTGSGGTSSESTSSGETSTSGGGGTSGLTKCQAPVTLASSTPLIADFDGYDGATSLGEWSFPLGGDSSVGVLAGTFVYGDDHVEGTQDVPEVSEMVDGNDSTYALSISDSEATEYGGGLGIWMSECVDASTFDGVSLWVRGNAPTGFAKITLLMEETTPIPEEGDTEAPVGTCEGTADDCIHPFHEFEVSDEWAEVQVPWDKFTGGNANGPAVEADGSNIWQIQFDIGLEWLDEDGDGVYEATPGPYELVIDDLSFY